MTAVQERDAQQMLADVDGLAPPKQDFEPAPSPLGPTGPVVRRIVRSEHIGVAPSGGAQRSALVDRLYGVYSETVQGDTREEFEAQIFSTDELRLVLFYGECDELAGFTYAGIERVAHAGRRLAVFGAGGFFRLGYRGGSSAMFWGLRQALYLKLREPRTPVAYCTRSSSPAVYRLLASLMPEIYPSRRYVTPADIEALARMVSARRKYVPVAEGSWVVRSRAVPRDPSRLRRLNRDADVRFYTELNPRFADGESLLVWIPLDVVNTVRGLSRVLRVRLAR